MSKERDVKKDLEWIAQALISLSWDDNFAKEELQAITQSLTELEQIKARAEERLEKYFEEDPEDYDSDTELTRKDAHDLIMYILKGDSK